MAEDKKPRGWFFNDYNPKSTEPELLEKLKIMEVNLARLDAKMDKIIESNKSLIAYFSTMSDHDIRDLNYKIRSYSAKTKQLPPVAFVPERMKK